MHQNTFPLAALAAAATLLLTACGGGGSSAQSVIDDDARAAAARSTAENNPKCSAATLGGYYWEIGNASGVLVSGTVGALPPSRTDRLKIYSASKWLYAASVVQQRGVRAEDVPYLNFTSGYSQFGNSPICTGTSIDSCKEASAYAQDPSTIGRYAYDSGHMQRHASAVMGLGAAGNATLANSLTAALGDFGFAYHEPQPAAGVEMSTSGYAGFLQKMLRGELALAATLGSNKVCTNPQQAGCNAARTADSAADENLNYSLGHWVEDDARYGDHAFSSAGGAGFYPWISSDKTVYGIVARERPAESAAGYHSLECGRLIRQAWRTGVPVTTPTPAPT